ncbi:MAG: hypothetical protein LH479_11700 [Polaromonas sp.]|nr:hypothetical protein [Polaromonas sp.]
MPELQTHRPTTGQKDDEKWTASADLRPAILKSDSHMNRKGIARHQALPLPELQTMLAAEGAIAAPATPEAFGDHILREIARCKPVIQSGRVRAEEPK